MLGEDETEEDNAQLDVEDVPVDETDLYQVLGVPKDATEKQLSTAFKRLALKYHPDRQTDGASAAHAQQRLHAINEAYNVLSDTSKREEYDRERIEQVQSYSDVSNVDGNVQSPGNGNDGSGLTSITRLFGAAINKLGLPSFAGQVSSDIIHTAEEICRNGGIEGGGPPLDTRVSDLPWGWAVESKVDRSVCAYYRLTVDETHAHRGFLVSVKSANRGKFKILLFDREGHLLHQEESFKEKSRNYSQATLFCTQFPTYRLTADAPLDAQQKSLPALFHRLDSFQSNQLALEAGQYLICIVGDNLLGKTSFSMVVVPAKAELTEAVALQATDKQLLHLQRELESVKSDYLQTKAAFDAIMSKMKLEEEKLEDLLVEREKQYTGLLNNVINAFNPLDITSHNPTEDRHDSDEHNNNNHMETTDKHHTEDSEEETSSSSTAQVAQHLLGLWGSAASTASTVGSNAAQSASAAGGWFARRLSNTVVHLQSIVQQQPQSSSSTEEDNNSAADSDTTAATATVVPVESADVIKHDKSNDAMTVGSASLVINAPVATTEGVHEALTPSRADEKDLEFTDA